MLNKKKNNKGFTLVELLVVIAIIGILAVVAVPALFKQIEKSNIAKLEADISSIKSSAMSLYADTGTYPTLEEIQAQIDGLSSPLNAEYELGDETAPATLTLVITHDQVSEDAIEKINRDYAEVVSVPEDGEGITINLIEAD